MRILPVLLLSMAAGVSQAADLSNRDSKSYDLKIHNGGTIYSSIGSNTTRPDICNSCKLEVSGVGEIEVSSSDRRIIIKNGSFDRE